jgi:hypothetical protein
MCEEISSKYWACGKYVSCDCESKHTYELLDALFTGCELPIQRHSFSRYTQEIEDDIKTMVTERPHLLECKGGHLRCREDVTPLFAACVNEKIPIHVVKFLLENGADPNLPILVNGRKVPIIEDLKINTSDRYRDISSILEEYSSMDIKPAKR